MDNNINTTANNQTNNLRAELYKYLIHWKWFFLASIIAVTVSILYIKTKDNIFETKATILIKEDGGASTELKMFQDLSSLGVGAMNNVFDEIEVLKSRALAYECVKGLELNSEMYEITNFKDVEIYNNKPIKYKVLSNKENFYKIDTFIDIKVLDAYQFTYSIEDSNKELVAKFGEKIDVGDCHLLLLPSRDLTKIDFEKKYRLKFEKTEISIEKIRKMIEVSSIDDYSNIISLTIRHANKSKAQDILNEIIDIYNKRSIDDQNIIGEKTKDFISKRLDIVKVELDDVDELEELYKSNKQITDIALQSQVFVDASSVNKKEIAAMETQLRLIEFMIEDIQKEKKDFQLLPTNIGITESPQLSMSVNNYNELLFERNRNLRTSSSLNPIVKNLNVELYNSINNIKESLINTKKQVEISLNSLSREETKFENKIAELPKQIREYREILRKQTIVADLYSYLLKKKEENEISLAVTVSKAKIIDRAYSINKPISPKKKIIVLLGLIIGLSIPLAIIYIRDLFDNKFKTRSELEEAISAPILGDIPFDTSGEKIVVTKGSRTSTAEAFRLLRTNLDFMLSSVDTTTKTIFVTSTISGEGKTFVAANVAASIALTGKKVLLTGLDLRAPKISQYLGLPNRKGVSNYLVDKNLLLEDLISPLDGFDNLDFLSSGVVPPNPAELLLSSRMESMFSELNEIYDYIVVDTAPVNLVTDTLMISQYADLFVYTVRSNYLDSNLLEVPERMYVEKRLPNMAVLLNGLDYTRGYGYGGYGYPKEDTHKNIFQRLFKK